jgi:pyruvate kinase
MDFKVIVTVGPAILDGKKLSEIDSLGSCIYRINGAHADAAQMAHIVNKIRSELPDATIMIDLPGNKVRTSNLPLPIPLNKGESLCLNSFEVNYPQFHRHLKPGDIMFANDSTYELKVTEVVGDTIHLLSRSNGSLGSNKGLHVTGIHAGIPFLFQRDLELIEGACALGLDVISLSFVRDVADIETARAIIAKKGGAGIEIFAKVETAMALENLDDILESVGTVNVDRGDLSSDIGILNIARAQGRVVRSARSAGKQVFLATQFLKNMEREPVPLISELIGLHQVVHDGVTGIQLSEETAVGKHPVECVKMVFDIFNNHGVYAA